MASTAIHDSAAHHDHGHHHETFLTKYIFSQDHKMIAKQFLITGIVMGVIAMILSVLFRLQLGWPDKSFPILETFLGKWAEGGRIKPDFYLALVTIHGTMMVFFVLTAGLSGTFSNLVILVLLFSLCDHDGFLLCRKWSCKCRLDNLSAIIGFAKSNCWFWTGDDLMVS
jgi:cytochrome c oxidase subunit 1